MNHFAVCSHLAPLQLCVMTVWHISSATNMYRHTLHFSLSSTLCLTLTPTQTHKHTASLAYMHIFFPPPSAGCSPWPRACYSTGLSKRELKAQLSHGSVFKVARLHSSTPKHTECWCYAIAFLIPPPQHINTHTPAPPLWDRAKDSGKKNQECQINNQWWPCLIHKQSSIKCYSSCNWRSGGGWSQIREPVSDVVDLIVTTVLGSAFICHTHKKLGSSAVLWGGWGAI